MSKELNTALYSSNLLVFFEDPFWVGVFQRTYNGEMSVCKVTFGSEPKDQEILEFILTNYGKLQFSPAVQLDKAIKKPVNPKRMQRLVKKQQQNPEIGTKSQQALKLQQEALKTTRKEKARKNREEEQERLFRLKQQQKKEKHRGR